MGGAVQPFLKWAGGKRWLAQAKCLPPIPRNGRYIEPFLGSGAMFFALHPERAILSDANPALVELYEIVRDQPNELRRKLEEHQSAHSKDHYYWVRSQSPELKLDRAARMLYLNRTCWNGLYRLNRKGEFNVPIGTKTNVLLQDDFVAVGRLLGSAEISACDFAETIRMAKSGDVVFADPPYTVKHNANGFLKYNERIFSWDDQIRLRDEVVAASKRGARVIVTNADHESVRELYKAVATYEALSRKSVLAADSAHRTRTTEALFTLGD